MILRPEPPAAARPGEEVVAVPEQTSGQAPASPGAPVGRPLLSLALTSMMDDVGAHSGAVYLRPGDEPVLEMAVMAGLPRSFAAPWERVGLSAPIPVAEAVRERRLVWVGGEEDMARRYPRIAVVLPYPFALAALPVATASRVYGAVFVTWPGSHPPELSDRERHRSDRRPVSGWRCGWSARRHATVPVLRRVGSAGAAPLGGVSDTLGSLEAARMVARLPYGMCSLDLSGRVGFANAAAAELLGVPVQRAAGLPAVGERALAQRPHLRGPLPGRADQPARHLVRGAAAARRWLSFRLYPSTTGLSVRISRARAVSEMRPGRSAAAGTRPPGW